MQRIKTVEIDGARFAGRRLGDGDAGPERIIGAVFKRNHDVQSVHAAALKHHDQDFAASALFSTRSTHEKCRRESKC